MAACLCLGPTGSGKTLLLKRLQSTSVNEGTSTVETVGSNIIRVPKKPVAEGSGATSSSSRGGEDKDFLSIQEIGGAMAPLWPSYFAPDKLIMYVIDSSNLFQVSISTVLLMELLSHEKLVGAKVLILLTKMDLTNRKNLNYLKFMMRLDTILAQSGRRVSLLEVSATTGDGLEDVRRWLLLNWPRVKKAANTIKAAARSDNG